MLNKKTRRGHCWDREERNFALLTLALVYTYMLKHAINTSQGLGSWNHDASHRKKIHGRKEWESMLK